MEDPAPPPKRPRTDAEMPPPSSVPKISPKLAPAEAGAAAGSTGSGSSAKILTTVDEVLAAFPPSPKNGPTAASSAQDDASSLADVLGTSPGPPPLKSPAYPNMSAGINNNGTRLKPNLSSEPPPLDLGYCGVFESPALMPASALGSVPPMDYLGPQMSR